MDLKNVGYRGPDMDDPEILKLVPPMLASVLGSINGWVQFYGGLHVRGACRAPGWHSLRAAWKGPDAFTFLYDTVHPDWVPFGEDCMGDQFFLKGDIVLRLDGETGDIEEEAVSLRAFLEAANKEPTAVLALEPLLQFRREGGDLQPGQLIHATPPFCSAESAQGVTLKAAPATEVHLHHADLAADIADEGMGL